MTAAMKGLVQYDLAPFAVELRELQVPQVDDDEVLLRVAAVGVCGSDIHQYHNTQSWPVKVPVVLGHEFCGNVARVGKRVRSVRDGDRVVSETAARICGKCIYCCAGEYNLCPDRAGFGYAIDGAMADYISVPERCLHRIPDTLSFEWAALTEPCSVAYNAVAIKSSIKPGDVVAVFGPGPIGLLCAEMARVSGAGTVIVVGGDGDMNRLDAARALGCHPVDGGGDDVLQLLHDTGDGLGADLIIDATGVSAALELALSAVRPGGQVTKVGWGADPIGFSLDPLVQKAVTLRGSFSHTFRNWERVISMLDAKQINIEPIISSVMRLEDWRMSFERMHGRDYVKCILKP